MHIHFHYFLSKKACPPFPLLLLRRENTVMLLPKVTFFCGRKQTQVWSVLSFMLVYKVEAFSALAIWCIKFTVECWFPLNLNVCLKCIWFGCNQPSSLYLSIKCDIHACFSTHHNSVSSYICDLSCVNELWKKVSIRRRRGSDDIFRTAWGHSFPYVLSFVKDYSRQNTKAFEGINFDLEKLSNT